LGKKLVSGGRGREFNGGQKKAYRGGNMFKDESVPESVIAGTIGQGGNEKKKKNKRTTKTVGMFAAEGGETPEDSQDRRLGGGR